MRAKANATLDAFYAEYGKMVKKAQENQEEIKQQIADFKAKLAEYEAWRANAEAVYKGLEAALTAASTVGVNITLPSAGFEINPGDFSVPPHPSHPFHMATCVWLCGCVVVIMM